MTIYLIGYAVSWVCLFTIVAFIVINDNEDEKAPLDILDITLVSMLSWLMVIGLIISFSLMYIESKD